MRKIISLLLATQYIISSLYIIHRTMIGFSQNQNTKITSNCHQIQSDNTNNDNGENECFETCTNKEKIFTKNDIILKNNEIKTNHLKLFSLYNSDKKTHSNKIMINFFGNDPPPIQNQMVYNGFIGKVTILLL